MSDSARKSANSTADEVTAWVETVPGAPGRERLDALIELAEAGEEADANPPFSEQTLVELHKAAESGAEDAPLRIAYAWTDPADTHSAGGPAGDDPAEGSTDDSADDRDAQRLLAGAGVVVLGDEDDPDVLEMVVRPNCRQHGIGGQLAAALADGKFHAEAAGGRIQRAWAHGGHDAAARLAVRFEWAPVRELWRMRLTTLDEVPSPDLPDDVTVTPFRPGHDEETWLRANAAAFADHPEQGRLTMEDLRARMEEDWFDPEGFLLAWGSHAEQGGARGADQGAEPELLGFHWTKVHPAEGEGAGEEHHGGRSEELGEVYVVGVVPDAQGRGLGRTLTLAGIEHLRSRGLGAIMLYVDSDNAAAVELYRKLGFTRWDVDTMYGPIVEPTAEPTA